MGTFHEERAECVDDAIRLAREAATSGKGSRHDAVLALASRLIWIRRSPDLTPSEAALVDVGEIVRDVARELGLEEEGRDEEVDRAIAYAEEHAGESKAEPWRLPRRLRDAPAWGGGEAGESTSGGPPSPEASHFPLIRVTTWMADGERESYKRPGTGEEHTLSWEELARRVQHPRVDLAATPKRLLPLMALATFRDKSEAEARAEHQKKLQAHERALQAWEAKPEQTRGARPKAPREPALGISWGTHFRDGAHFGEAYALCLDLDNPGDATAATIQEAFAGVATIAHTTASHTPEAPCWRVFVLLSRPADAATVKLLMAGWAGPLVIRSFTLGPREDSAGKPKPLLDVRPAEQGWHVPAPKPGYESAVVDGLPLDVDAVLAELAKQSPKPPRLPADEQQPDKLALALSRNNEGAVRPTAANLLMILHDDPAAPQVKLSEFDHQIELTPPGEAPRPLADTDIIREIARIETAHRVSFGVDCMDRCIALVAEERSFNPLQNYLGGLVHDGTPRLATWLIEAAGTRDTPTVRAYSRRWLIGAVARAMNPGCKLDTALVLVGAQGEGKSTLFKVLAGEEFFVDSPIEIGQKDAYLTIDRAWIYEFSELASLSRKEVRAVKGFLTSTHDEFRPPYGRRNVRLGRHCAFCGTTNDLECLHDATGDRRFWPVTVGKVDLGWIRANRDQLWAEAVACWRAGEQWWLTPEEQTASEQHSDAFRELDSWTPLVEEILDALPEPKGIRLFDLAQLLRDGSRRENERGLSPPELARDGKETDQRLRNILKRLGWSTGGKPSWDPTTKKVARLWRPDPTLRPYACLTVADEGTVRSDSPKESSGSESTLHPYAENIGKTTVDVGRDGVEGWCRGGCGGCGESMYVPQRKVLGSPDSELRSTPSDLTPPIANKRKVAPESPETPLFNPDGKPVGDLLATPFPDPLDDDDDGIDFVFTDAPMEVPSCSA